jgi:hypothetical protein
LKSKADLLAHFSEIRANGFRSFAEGQAGRQHQACLTADWCPEKTRQCRFFLRPSQASDDALLKTSLTRAIATGSPATVPYRHTATHSKRPADTKAPAGY